MIVLDAYAVIAMMVGEHPAGRVRTLIAAGGTGITSVNLGECSDVLQRRFRVPGKQARSAIATLTGGPVAVLSVDERDALFAADLRARHYHRSDRPVSLGDCLLLAAASGRGEVATGDGALLEMAADEGIATVDLRTA